MMASAIPLPVRLPASYRLLHIVLFWSRRRPVYLSGYDRPIFTCTRPLQPELKGFKSKEPAPTHRPSAQQPFSYQDYFCSVSIYIRRQQKVPISYQLFNSTTKMAATPIKEPMDPIVMHPYCGKCGGSGVVCGTCFCCYGCCTCESKCLLSLYINGGRENDKETQRLTSVRNYKDSNRIVRSVRISYPFGPHNNDVNGAI